MKKSENVPLSVKAMLWVLTTVILILKILEHSAHNSDIKSGAGKTLHNIYVRNFRFHAKHGQYVNVKNSS